MPSEASTGKIGGFVFGFLRSNNRAGASALGIETGSRLTEIAEYIPLGKTPSRIKPKEA